jgi:hypothetical protein
MNGHDIHALPPHAPGGSRLQSLTHGERCAATAIPRGGRPTDSKGGSLSLGRGPLQRGWLFSQEMCRGFSSRLPSLVQGRNIACLGLPLIWFLSILFISMRHGQELLAPSVKQHCAVQGLYFSGQPLRTISVTTTTASG